MTSTAVPPEALEWITSDDTGLSSKTLWAVMVGSVPATPRAPQDGDDFSRCYRLLARIPAWRERLSEVAERYPEWVGLVREWADLEALYVAQRGRDLYERMRPLIDEGLEAAGWERRGPNSWRLVP